MEARLFFISLWCGVYGQLLRLLVRHKKDEKIWVTMILDALFWGTGFGLLGMLFASYSEKIDRMDFYSLLFVGFGLLIGAGLGMWNGRSRSKRDEMLEDNLEWADTGFSAILLASVVMFFVIQAFKIPSGSMRMTFIEGDHLFVNKFIYGIRIPLTDKKILPLRKITPGDVVIFRFPSTDRKSPHYGKDFIKRVIALEGQKVQVVDKVITIDGKRLMEPYTQHDDGMIFGRYAVMSPEEFQRRWENRELAVSGGNEIRDNFGPVVVPKGSAFVMGDNRDRSFDSRYWGPLPKKDIKGKAWILYWPPKRIRWIWNTTLQTP
ncbi:MAG: signal peptidase I [Elusimicrobia bacterium]|nr:signal peptidase I [Candidatus Obscuribacterium magneticum]